MSPVVFSVMQPVRCGNVTALPREESNGRSDALSLFPGSADGGRCVMTLLVCQAGTLLARPWGKAFSPEYQGAASPEDAEPLECRLSSLGLHSCAWQISPVLAMAALMERARKVGQHSLAIDPWRLSLLLWPGTTLLSQGAPLSNCSVLCSLSGPVCNTQAAGKESVVRIPHRVATAPRKMVDPCRRHFPSGELEAS